MAGLLQLSVSLLYGMSNTNISNGYRGCRTLLHKLFATEPDLAGGRPGPQGRRK